MAKNLKLTGLKTYTNGVMNGVCVKKGEVIRFNDTLADQVLLGKRMNAERDDVPYFVETDEPATLDFSSPLKTDGSEHEVQKDTASASAVVAAAGQRAPARRSASK